MNLRVSKKVQKRGWGNSRYTIDQWRAMVRRLRKRGKIRLNLIEAVFQKDDYRPFD